MRTYCAGECVDLRQNARRRANFLTLSLHTLLQEVRDSNIGAGEHVLGLKLICPPWTSIVIMTMHLEIAFGPENQRVIQYNVHYIYSVFLL